MYYTMISCTHDKHILITVQFIKLQQTSISYYSFL